jgi:esterase/lipase
MKEIYFDTESRSISKVLKKKIINASSYTLAKISPKISNELAEKVLCTPIRPKIKRKIPSDFKVTKLKILDSVVNVYTKGTSDKYILFSHGWSGNAFNFSSFFDDFIDAGYSIICFDQIAHGYSEGKISNYYFFYNVFESVYKELVQTYNILGVVGHSMGASAIIGAKLPKELKLCLVAPLIPVFESLYSNTDSFGISSLTVKNFLKSYENRFSVSLNDIDPKNIVSKLKNDIYIVHSKDDQFIDHENNVPFYNQTQLDSVDLIDGVGHFRILKSEEVINKCLDFFL